MFKTNFSICRHYSVWGKLHYLFRDYFCCGTKKLFSGMKRLFNWTKWLELERNDRIPWKLPTIPIWRTIPMLPIVKRREWTDIITQLVNLSNSIARACFIFLLCTLMTSANKSSPKKNFHRVENVIKHLVHVSAARSSRYEALGKFGEHSRS